jgi:hypothetical protein
MRRMRTTLICLSFLAACGGKGPAPATGAVTGSADAGARACTARADCAEDEMCAGPPGCGVAWTCVPERPCTMDLRAYCSCDGETIHGSGTCPPAPYQHAGECD